jgi:hypothetical protein
MRSREVKTAFTRLSHCARRAPAKLRHLLHEKMSAALENGNADLEVIEELLVTSRRIFEQFPDAEAAQTALSALGIDREYGYDTIGLIDDFSSLSPPLQENCKSALSLAVMKRSFASKLSPMSVQLRAHVSTLIRKRWPNRLNAILVADANSWPLHLQLAWRILRESGLSGQQARVLVHNSVIAGYECARRLNETAQTTDDRKIDAVAVFNHRSRHAARIASRS